MYHSRFQLVLLALASTQLPPSSAKVWKLQKTYNATNFFDQFNFRDAAYFDSINPDYHGDPTDGSVNYLNRENAIAAGLAKIQDGKVYLGVDNTNVAPPREGNPAVHARPSVRLESKQTWKGGLMIADIQHQPGTQCGVWPSFWAYNFNEDPVGEIDIIENVNIQDQNIVSLHTCGNCQFDRIGGDDQRTNCNNGGALTEQCSDGKNFDGCGNTMKKGSYGTAFNMANGGVYATLLDKQQLKIWFWPRNRVPKDVAGGYPNPDRWGRASSAFLQSTVGCRISRYFKDLTIIINTDFCGSNIDQASWDEQCRERTGVIICDSYITNNPLAFKETYWLFNSIKFYN